MTIYGHKIYNKAYLQTLLYDTMLHCDNANHNHQTHFIQSHVFKMVLLISLISSCKEV